MGTVSPERAQIVKDKTGLDVSGYERIVDNSSVRHAFKQHGNQEKEALRGQVAITSDDFGLIPEIVENPDTVSLGEKTSAGLETILYSKRFNGTTYFVEEVRTGRRKLAPVTLYKRVAKKEVSVSPSSHAQDVSVAQSPQRATAETDTEIDNSIGRQNAERNTRKIEEAKARLKSKYFDVPDSPKDTKNDLLNKSSENPESETKPLAPNGKPSNLTPFQHRQVRTAEFKRWFGDWETDPENASKVVDENGEPLIVYHGTGADIESFRTIKKPNKFTVDNAFFFAAQPHYADLYSRKRADERDYQENANILPVFLNIRELYEAKNTINQVEVANLKDYFDTLTIRKYDGIQGIDTGSQQSVYVTFKSNQIKSAVGNTGEFSSDNDSILYSLSSLLLKDSVDQNPNLPFYSQLEKTITDKMPNRASVEQVRAILSNGSVKQAETDAIGIDEFLDGKDSVTKDKVLNYVRANKLEVEEVVKGEVSEKQKNKFSTELKSKGYKIEYGEDGTAYGIEDADGYFYGQNEIDELPGSIAETFKNLLNQNFGIGDAKFSPVQLGGEAENYRERFVTAPQFTETWVDGHKEFGDIKNPVVRLRTADRTNTENSKVLFVEEFQPPKKEHFSRMPNVLQKYAYSIGVKNALRLAVEGGYSAIAWTTGRQQVERGNLRNYIDRIQYRKAGINNDKFSVKAYDLERRTIQDEVLDEQELEANYGKTVARKIIENAAPQVKIIAGEDLQEKNEGLKNLYDKIIPNLFNKIIKKFGARVGQSEINTGEENETVHSVELTPKLAEEIAKGLPLFRVRDEQSENELSKIRQSAFAPQTIEKATAKSTAFGTELNVEAIELLRRAFVNAGFSAKTFDGVFLEPKQLEKTQTELRELSNDLREIGEAKASEAVKNISQVLSENATKNKTAIAYIFDDAVPHERFHEAGYITGINKAIEERHGKNIERLFNSPAVQKAYKNYFQSLGYGKNERGVLVEETADYLATGEREKLGLTEAEATEFLLDWAESFAEINGIESLDKFREISETFDKVIKEVKNAYEQRQAEQQRTEEREGNGDQRGNQSESDERGKTRADNPSDESRRSEPESGTQTTERDEHDRIKSVTSETDEQIKQKNRKFAESLANAGIDIGSVLYPPQTVKGWEKSAFDTIERNLADGKGIDGAIEDYEKLDARTSEGHKTALGTAIVTHLYIEDDRAKLREFGRELTKDIGNAAQELRAAQLMSRFDPEFAPIYAENLKQKGQKLPLTEKEEQEVLELARKLSDISDNHALAQAASEEHEEHKKRLETEQKSLEAALKSGIQPSPKNESEIKKKLAEIQEQIADYNSSVEKPKSNKSAKEIAQEIKNKKSELLKKIIQEFGGNPQHVSSAPLLMASKNAPAFDALIELGALKLIEDLPNGLSLKDFDSYINFLSNNKLSAEQIVEIHAQSYEIAKGERSPLTDEAKLRQKNRYEHARRANLFLNADEIEAKRIAKENEIAERLAARERKAEEKRIEKERKIEAQDLAKEIKKAQIEAAKEIERREKEQAQAEAKADREAARQLEAEERKQLKEQTDEALKNKNAYRNDKYSRKIVNIAKAFNLDEKTVFAAVAIRELGNKQIVFESMKNTYPGISKNEIESAFVSGVELRRRASEELTKEIADRKAGYKLTDEEYQKLQNQIKTARIAERKARKALEIYYKQLTRSTGMKVFDNVLDVYNLVRGLAYSADIGFVLRQGGIPLLANTKAWKNSLIGIKPAFQSEEKFDSFVDGIHNDVRRQTLESYGAEFETIGDEASFSEEFLSKFAGKIPGIKHTNRAHALTTDLFRFNIGNQVFAEIDAMNLEPEQKERAKEFLAKKWVNVITGKGYIGNTFGVGSTSSKVVSTIFGAPRFAVAGFQFLYYTNPVRMAFLPKGARKIVAKATLRTYTPLAMMATVLGALGLMNLDPEDKDFLVINENRLAELTGIESFKNQYFDFLGGKKEPLRLVYGLPLKAIFYALAGKPEGYKRIWKSLKAEFFGTDDRFSPYLRGKLNPAASIGLNLWEGEDLAGQSYTWSDVPADLFLPILLREMAGAASYDKKQNILHTQSKLDWKSENIGRTLTTLILSFLGVGVGNYPKRETTTAYKQAVSQNNFRDDEYEPEEKQKRRQIESALKRLVREDEDVSSEIESYLSAGIITEEDVEAIRNAKKTSAIEDVLKTADEAAINRALQFASKKENWLNNRIEEAATERAALEKMLLNRQENAAEKEDRKQFDTLKKQVQSGGLPYEEAEEALIRQLDAGKISASQFEARKKILSMSKTEEQISNMDASSSSDFKKIEDFVKNLEPEDRENVFRILEEKARNKFEDNSKKSNDEGERLIKIIEDSFLDFEKKPSKSN